VHPDDEFEVLADGVRREAARVDQRVLAEQPEGPEMISSPLSRLQPQRAAVNARRYSTV
jgi:hypothetical protein